MSLPVTVLGGYLGAGKTTLVNAILAAPHGLRVAVVVNDFGSVNIDADLIASRAATRLDLTNGCACCQIGDRLGDAFYDLLDDADSFDRVVVEASGVADPASVASWAGLPGLSLDGVVVAADPLSIARLTADRLVGPTVVRQLAVADVVVLTRADVASAAELAAAEAVVRGTRCTAPIVRCGNGPVPVAALFDLNPVGAVPDDHLGHDHVAVSWVPAGPVAVDLLVSTLATVPGLLRAKGFVQAEDGPMMLVQLAGRRIEVSPWEGGAVEPVLVGIGHRDSFDGRELERILSTL